MLVGWEEVLAPAVCLTLGALGPLAGVEGSDAGSGVLAAATRVALTASIRLHSKVWPTHRTRIVTKMAGVLAG